MVVQVHGLGGSAPCRIVYMTCEALGIEYEMVTCDLQKGENRTPEYLKVCKGLKYLKIPNMSYIR